MEPKKIAPTRTLLLWSTSIVVGHFIAVVWHLFLVIKAQPGFPGFAPPLLILINLIPVAGIIAFAKGFPKLAGCMTTLPLAVALVIGIYAHFLSTGADNIFRMPPGDLTLPFQVSAVLFALLEALGCWVGIRIFVQISARDML
jgi:hypothetical protein